MFGGCEQLFMMKSPKKETDLGIPSPGRQGTKGSANPNYVQFITTSIGRKSPSQVTGQQSSNFATGHRASRAPLNKSGISLSLNFDLSKSYLRYRSFGTTLVGRYFVCGASMSVSGTRFHDRYSGARLAAQPRAALRRRDCGLRSLPCADRPTPPGAYLRQNASTAFIRRRFSVVT